MMRGATCLSLLVAAPVDFAQGLQLQAKDPKWDKKAVQDAGTYESDFVKDDREHGGESVESKGLNEYNHHDVPQPAAGGEDVGPGPAKHSAAWYEMKCNEINGHCQFLADHRMNAARADKKHFQDECEKQKKILADKKATHSSEKAEVADQKVEVAQQKQDVVAAKADVKELAHCPPELASAKADLARLQAIPNQTPSDIDAECKAQQRVLDAQKCVDKFNKAEAVLSHEADQHAGEKAELAHEETHVSPAASAVPPQKEEVIEACARAAEIAKRPLEGSVAGILSNCRAQKDDLLAGLGDDLAALDDECAKQKRILVTKEGAHKEEKAEHRDQKVDAAAAKTKVDAAEVDVRELAHCPPELTEARAELARLEAIANKSPADIDDECEAHQRILVAEKCVDKYDAAQAVLAHKEGLHYDEKQHESEEASERSAASAAVPPQESVVAKVCGDFDAARARWEAALAACRA